MKDPRRIKYPALHDAGSEKSSEVYGQTNIGGKGGTRIPIAGIAGDQQAALYGQMCASGTSENHLRYGLLLADEHGTGKVTSNNGLLTTLACSPRGEPAYALGGRCLWAVHRFNGCEMS